MVDNSIDLRYLFCCGDKFESVFFSVFVNTIYIRKSRR